VLGQQKKLDTRRLPHDLAKKLKFVVEEGLRRDERITVDDARDLLIEQVCLPASKESGMNEEGYRSTGKD
jgi:hypothetical protein